MRTIVITSDRRYWLLSTVQSLLLGFLYRARAYTVRVKGTGMTLPCTPWILESARIGVDYGYSPSLCAIIHTLYTHSPPSSRRTQSRQRNHGNV